MPKTSARLLSLLSLLQARRDWPGALLAARLEVSPRTVRRDVERLRELGYPVTTVKGPDGGYRLEAGTRMPPLLFDDDQAVAVAVALRLAPAAGADIGVGAARALNTVRQVMPARLRHRVDTLVITTVGARPEPLLDPAVLVALGAAVHNRDVLRFRYRSATPSEATPAGPKDEFAVPRRVEPHHLVVWKGRWYLLAWDLDRADWRTFRADRVTPLTPTGPRFHPRDLPAEDVATFITARFRGSDSTTEWPCRGSVLLHLPAAKVAAHAQDDLVEELGPDLCRLHTGSWSWPALAASLGRFDTGIEVLGPPELQAAFARLAALYADAAHPRSDE
ncbi:WYL domain-containing protein [Actinocorallia sp. API 0066]|uniref:helix-turn-helix transcriptional regulator n=1 Tax=Actinocorallia sp. API 0066 TaxID=2896846 RepID=UPI001E646C92|nr:WYL domain-containing protein [Actinocorallia sp. API 0066]MCD0449290.1 WYL domain-containing protein [Actinocorallia sp. API 0066]